MIRWSHNNLTISFTVEAPPEGYETFPVNPGNYGPQWEPGARLKVSWAWAPQNIKKIIFNHMCHSGHKLVLSCCFKICFSQGTEQPKLIFSDSLVQCRRRNSFILLTGSCSESGVCPRFTRANDRLEATVSGSSHAGVHGVSWGSTLRQNGYTDRH